MDAVSVARVVSEGPAQPYRLPLWDGGQEIQPSGTAGPGVITLHLTARIKLELSLTGAAELRSMLRRLERQATLLLSFETTEGGS